jgi:signal peptidase II
VGVAHGSQIGRRRAITLFLIVGLAVLVVDQVTKHLSVVYLEDREPVRLLWGAFYLTLVRNGGAAFSLGTGYTFVFPVVALVVTVVLAIVIRNVRSTPWAIGLGLVLGGAFGNFTDRLFRWPGPFLGHVVDMVSAFDPHGQVFPVFNAADSALFLGVVSIILLELTGRQRDGTRLPSRAERAAAEATAAAAESADQPAATRDSDEAADTRG